MYPFKDILFVVIQFILLSFFLFIRESSIDMPYPLHILGLVLSVVGIIIVLVSILQLNKSLSPFPTPKQNGQLVTNGLYHYVRHPIYSGIICGAVGFSLFQGSITLAIVTILLTLLFYFKARYEEGLLVVQYPKYAMYQNHTKMLIPFLL
jgi:protein-S-isoprenylcysteine O-methyltransferase Ste14